MAAMTHTYSHDRVFRPCVEGEHDECAVSRSASHGSMLEHRITRACKCPCHPAPSGVIECGHCGGWFTDEDYRAHIA